MESSRAWRRALDAVKTVVAIVTAVACFSTLTTPALAGTTGIITGTVTDASGAPLAGVSVTAKAPTGTYGAKTDSHGFYSIAGIYSDTYNLSFEHEGYEPQIVTGVTVFADESSRQDIKLSKSLKTIVKVTSTSTSSAYQRNQTNNTVTVNSQGIENLLGTAVNNNEAELVQSLPGASLDANGFPIIHGGREDEAGWQFEGIPYTDPYSNQFTNALTLPGGGVASIQITAGPGDAANATNGTGSFNIVAKRGSYPAYSDCEGSLGTGGFDHRLTCEYSFATLDGKYSDYAAFYGSNNAPAIGTGIAPLAQLGEYSARRLSTDREFENNFIFKWGKNHQESLQFFADMDEVDIYTGQGGLNGICFASCDPGYTGTWGGIYGMSAQQVQAISALYPYQTSQNETLAQSNRAPGTYYEPNQAYKLEYTNSFNSSTYASVRLYRANSTTVFDFPATEGSFDGDSYIEQGGQTTGGTISLTKLFGEHHQVQIGADYHLLHPIDSYVSQSFGLYGAYIGALDGALDQYSLPYAFLSPSDPNCPLGADGSGNSYCGYAYGAGHGASQLTFPGFDQVAQEDQQNYSLYVNDKITVNDRLSGEVGIRWDAVNNLNMPAVAVDPNYCTTLYLPATWTANPNYNPANPLGNGNCPFNATFNVPAQALSPKVFQPRLALNYAMGNNTSIRFTYSRGVAFPNIATVAFGDIDQSAYLNQYGILPSYNAFYNAANGLPAGQITAAGSASTNCGILPLYVVPCKNFGQQLYWVSQNFDGIPFQPVKPMTSNNYQVTLSHQFTKGWLDGVAVSVAPWNRFQYDTEASEAQPLLNAQGQPIIIQGSLQQLPAVFTNNAKEFASGVDLNITKQNPVGLSGQFTASYINEFSSVIPLSGSEDFYPNIPYASVQAGNVYRVGFVSPFTATLGLTYKTKNGWRFNPRFHYDIGYPFGEGTSTAALINGVGVNVPNTNAVVGSAPNGPAYYVDPLDPGSVLNPNIDASKGYADGAFPGEKLTPANMVVNMTVEFAPPRSRITYGFDVENLFDEHYGGPEFNDRYQPVATGIGGPLTGYSTNSLDFSSYPTAWPQYGSFMNGSGVFVNIPYDYGRTFLFYINAKL